METMTKDQMVQFLRGMNAKKQFLSDEKKRLKGSIESLEEAISRNSFARKDDNLGTSSGCVNTDKVLHVLLNSRRDIEEETRNCVIRMHDIYAAEDQIDYVCRCLYRLDGQDQYLINEVYVKDVIMDQLTNILNMSRSNIYRLLSRALERLLCMYNEGCKSAESYKADRLMADIRPYLPAGCTA